MSSRQTLIQAKASNVLTFQVSARERGDFGVCVPRQRVSRWQIVCEHCQFASQPNASEILASVQLGPLIRLQDVGTHDPSPCELSLSV